MNVLKVCVHALKRVKSKRVKEYESKTIQKSPFLKWLGTYTYKQGGVGLSVYLVPNITLYLFENAT